MLCCGAWSELLDPPSTFPSRPVFALLGAAQVARVSKTGTDLVRCQNPFGCAHWSKQWFILWFQLLLKTKEVGNQTLSGWVFELVVDTVSGPTWQKASAGDSVEADCLIFSLESISLVLSLSLSVSVCCYQILNKLQTLIISLIFAPLPSIKTMSTENLSSLNLAQCPSSMWLVMSKSQVMLLPQYIAEMGSHSRCSPSDMWRIFHSWTSY